VIRIPVSQPSLGPRETYLVNQALKNNQITQGPMVAEFEEALARYLDVPHVIVCSSGTAALHLALLTVGCGPGHEVLVPDVTFVATANAVTYTGARVVLVDVDPGTWCMDAGDANVKITHRTRAIIPVHLYGYPCGLENLPGCIRVEDAAEALGGQHWGRHTGTASIFSRLAVFSFYGNKVLTTGEGGAVVAHTDEDAEVLRHLRGQALDPARRYYHDDIGYNYRMTELQAAIGLGQMLHLEDRLERRHDIFRLYHKRLGTEFATNYTWVNPDKRDVCAPWLYTIRLDQGVNRQKVIDGLASEGIETRPTFVPMHRLPMYAGRDQDFPHASFLGDQGLSLPTYPDMTDAHIEEVVDALRKYAR
jgi:perosamine synthetase